MENLKKYIPLNLPLMANPVNWVIVALVVALAGVGLAAILTPDNAITED